VLILSAIEDMSIFFNFLLGFLMTLVLLSDLLMSTLTDLTFSGSTCFCSLEISTSIFLVSGASFSFYLST
tara:strand:+ start:331 stop:540 length:210 start_codon:yes stop_codon:yes gene_type:complete